MPNQTLPNFYNMKFTDKDGNMTPDSSLYMDQTFQTLNSIITINGIVVPSLTTVQVTALPTTVAIGTLWFNSTLNALQFKGNTGVQQITSV